MTRAVWIAIATATLATGCVNNRCLQPTGWRPCTGERESAGASGTPPAIVSFVMPTCNYLETPGAKANLEVDDADGDAQTFKATFYRGVGGPRENLSEVPLDPGGFSGTLWSGELTLSVMQASEGSFDVRVKVVDREGGQSRPLCETFTLVR